MSPSRSLASPGTPVPEWATSSDLTGATSTGEPLFGRNMGTRKHQVTEKAIRPASCDSAAMPITRPDSVTSAATSEAVILPEDVPSDEHSGELSISPGQA